MSCNLIWIVLEPSSVITAAYWQNFFFRFSGLKVDMIYVIKHNVCNDCRVAAKILQFSRLKVDFSIQCNGNFKKVGQITQKLGFSRTF